MKGVCGMESLQGKVILITGSSRGIGREIALRCAREGATIIITGKTREPHPTLPGTIYTVATEVVNAGGKALPLELDVRNEDQIEEVVQKAIQTFGKIDILINNASAISLTPTLETTMKRFDLLFSVNTRATYACSRACLPYLLQSENPHILTLSPPLNMNPKWFKMHLAYTMSKYGMSMCTLGLAEEFKDQKIAVNSLWPKTTIATMAVKVHLPPEVWETSRKPAIVADAAFEIIRRESGTWTGNFFIDEDVLRTCGVSDFEQYALQPGKPHFPDIFLD